MANKDEAERIAGFMNFYLTETDKDYSPDFEKLSIHPPEEAERIATFMKLFLAKGDSN